MTHRLLLYYIACIATMVVVSSCHTQRKATARSRQPKFIDDVYMNGHSRSNATVSGTPYKGKGTPPKPDGNTPEVCQPDEPLPTLSKKEMNSIKRKYADMMDVKSKELDNNTLYEFIDLWYGTAYRLGGCDRSGIDCSGFSQKLYSDVFGIDLSRTAAGQYSDCKRVKHSKDASQGDLVFFHARGKRITHVGIYLTNDYFVHASTSNGVIISNLNEDYWHRHFSGFGKVKKK